MKRFFGNSRRKWIALKEKPFGKHCSHKISWCLPPLLGLLLNSQCMQFHLWCIRTVVLTAQFLYSTRTARKNLNSLIHNLFTNCELSIPSTHPSFPCSSPLHPFNIQFTQYPIAKTRIVTVLISTTVPIKFSPFCKQISFRAVYARS